VLAVTGIYSLTSYVAAQRTPEMGLRICAGCGTAGHPSVFARAVRAAGGGVRTRAFHIEPAL
jgi:hypothetical protein